MGHRELATYHYAVVNPLQTGRSRWNDLATVALVPADLPHKAGAMPRLLDLTTLDHGQQAALLEIADAWDRENDFPFFALLLKSADPFARVAAHLARQLVVRAPDGSAALLRWHDPRVFRHLCWRLTPVQMRTLSGPVRAWCWREHHGNWRTHEVAECGDAGLRLYLTPGQWATIGRLGVLNRTIAQLGRGMPAPAPSDELCRRLDSCLQQAYDHHGLTDEADARLFVEQAIHDPQIHQRPEIVQRLELARQGRVSYVGACADLDIGLLSTPCRPHNLQRKDAVT
ncbi:DUF4123 domain-containing protein [Luteimonas yindakuii]|nr:DUF4123 domain-containing protein [Luteimonas yindakuii]